MSTPLTPEEIREKAANLTQAMKAREQGTHQESAKSSGVRIATDVMVSIGVGMFLGYWIDQWLGSKPWAMMLGLGFGIAAGIRSAIRSNDALEKAERRDQS